MNTTSTVKVKDLTLRGNGIANAQKTTYEIPFTLPEETVEVTSISAKGSHRLALLRRVVTPSSLRKKPDCRHYGTCGACHYRHVSYNKSLQIKEKLIIRELEKINSMKKLDAVIAGLKMVGAEDPKHYRNNARFYVQEKHLHQHTMLTHNNFEVKECFVVSTHSWEKANQWKWQLPSHVQEVEIRENTQGEQMWILTTTEQHKIPQLPVHSLYLFDPEKKVYTHILGEKTLPQYLTVAGQSFVFDIGPDSFFQVHTAMTERLYQYVSKFIPRTGVLFDLYAGTGTVGIIMAKLFPELTVQSIEIGTEMVEIAKHNATKNNVANISFLQSDVRTHQFSTAPDCIVVDPPRNGLTQESLDHLISLGTKTIVYISCNPETFIRDTKQLLSCYELRMVRLFDMMPFTSHMEVVGVFERVERA